MSRRNVPTRKPAASTRRGVQPPSASASAKSITQARAQRDAKRGDAVTVDFVDETEMRKHETFGCVMFATPGPTMIEAFKEEVAIETNVPLATVDKVVKAYCTREHPKRAVKYVGGYATEAEANARIKQIEDDEPMFHIWLTENGKWLVFDPSPELVQNEEYREKELNDLMKSKKLNEQHTKDFYRQEMRKRVERARLEGTKEGQEILMQAEEPLQAVEHRVKAAEDGINEMREKIAEFERTKELAQRKLEYMRANNGTTLDPALQVKSKMDELAVQMPMTDERVQDVKMKLLEAQAIEASRKRDVSSADVAKHMLGAGQSNVAGAASQSNQSALSGPVKGENAGLFESEPVIPRQTSD
jgi:hypothetical protein